MLKKIFIITIILILSITSFVYGAPGILEVHDMYSKEGFYPNTNPIIIPQNEYITVNFDYPVTLYKIKPSNNRLRVRMFDKDGNLLYTHKVNTFSNDYTKTIYDVKYVEFYGAHADNGSPLSVTINGLYLEGEVVFNLKTSNFNNKLKQYVFEFTDTPIINDDIIIKNSIGQSIDYELSITDKKIILQFDELQQDTYTIETFTVSNNNTDKIVDVPQKTFVYSNPLTFIQKIYNKIENTLTYIFSKDIKVDKSDIIYRDKDNNEFDFDYEVNKNKLIIFIDNLKEGIFKIKPLKVDSIDDLETLTNLPEHTVQIYGIQLINKNFGNYISSGLQNLILTFDKNIESLNVVLKNNTDNVIVPTNYIISDNKIYIDYDSLTDDIDYTLEINTLKSVDNFKIDLLTFNFKTIKTTGDVGIDTIISEFLNIFTEAQNRGTKIVILAIALGIIFIIAKWLWNKTKLWLKKS